MMSSSRDALFYRYQGRTLIDQRRMANPARHVCRNIGGTTRVHSVRIWPRNTTMKHLYTVDSSVMGLKTTWISGRTGYAHEWVATKAPLQQVGRRVTSSLSSSLSSSSSSETDPADGGRMMSDARVPEGHKKLHEKLYGDTTVVDSVDSESVHDAYQDRYEYIEGEDDGSSLVPIDVFIETRQRNSTSRQPPVGVFAIYDEAKALLYVSYSRNIVLSVKSILDQVGKESCAYVRNMVFLNTAMQTRQAMEEQQQRWIDEHGTIPPGNGPDKDMWSVGFDVKAMSQSEKDMYDEKRNKMVAAMGQRVEQEDDGSLDMAKLRSAVEEGDWSEVIQDQQSGPDTKTTPFVQAQVHRVIGDHGNAQKGDVVMTVETVDEALEEVRPFLVADGGDVKVVEVDQGRVVVQLQGACGSCAASSSTMKMGIERCLIAAFGDQLKEVIEIGGGAENIPPTVESVNAHIDGLRGAIGAYGGSVEVVAVDPPLARIGYVGPKPLAYGLLMALKDKFPELTSIHMYDGETGDTIDFDSY